MALVGPADLNLVIVAMVRAARNFVYRPAGLGPPQGRDTVGIFGFTLPEVTSWTDLTSGSEALSAAALDFVLVRGS
jgi:hypothetical protein